MSDDVKSTTRAAKADSQGGQHQSAMTHSDAGVFKANLNDDLLDPDTLDGYGTQGPERVRSGPDHGAAEGDGKDSQVGAAPLHDTRYREGNKGTYGQGSVAPNPNKTRSLRPRTR